jgi:hypothetical protein
MKRALDSNWFWAAFVVAVFTCAVAWFPVGTVAVGGCAALVLLVVLLAEAHREPICAEEEGAEWADPGCQRDANGAMPGERRSGLEHLPLRLERGIWRASNHNHRKKEVAMRTQEVTPPSTTGSDSLSPSLPMAGICMDCGIEYRRGRKPASHGICDSCLAIRREELNALVHTLHATGV